MLDSNGNLTQAAKEYLTNEEINIFNSSEKQSAGWFIERHSAASRLLSAAIQRKALLEIEGRGKRNSLIANGIAGLALIALIIQTLVQAFW